jgi:hypothetical protein
MAHLRHLAGRQQEAHARHVDYLQGLGEVVPDEAIQPATRRGRPAVVAGALLILAGIALGAAIPPTLTGPHARVTAVAIAGAGFACGAATTWLGIRTWRRSERFAHRAEGVALVASGLLIAAFWAIPLSLAAFDPASF